MMKLFASAVLVGLVGAASSPALASTPEEWAAFAKDVETACLKAGEPLFEKARALVDPQGSENYGLALLRGKAKGGTNNIAVICVYNKQTKAVEVGGELSKPAKADKTPKAEKAPKAN